MADTPKLRWLPCKNCGRAWLSKTEPYILGGGSIFPMRYRCYRCRGDSRGTSGSGKGGVQGITGAQWAALPPVPWGEIEKYFPGWIESHYDSEASWETPRESRTVEPPQISTPMSTPTVAAFSESTDPVAAPSGPTLAESTSGPMDSTGQ